MKKQKHAEPKMGRPRLVLMEVVSVKIKNGYKDSQVLPDAFLREAGFVSICSKGGSITAVVPPSGGDTTFIVEYASRTKGLLKHFRLVRIRSGRTEHLDNGLIHLVLPGTGEELELIASGDEVSTWEIVVKPASIAKIPESGAFCANETESADNIPRSSGASTPRNLNDSFIPGHAETSMLSPAAGMIAEIVARCAPSTTSDSKMGEKNIRPYKRLELAVSPRIVNRFNRHVVPVEKPSVRSMPMVQLKPSVQPRVDNRPKWQTSPLVKKFLKQFAEGEERKALEAAEWKWSADILSKVITKWIEEGGNSPKTTSELLGLSVPVINKLQFVQNLHLQLRPLLDLTIDDLKRITLQDLHILTTFNEGEQLVVWGDVAKQVDRCAIARQMVWLQMHPSIVAEMMKYANKTLTPAASSS